MTLAEVFVLVERMPFGVRRPLTMPLSFSGYCVSGVVLAEWYPLGIGGGSMLPDARAGDIRVAGWGIRVGRGSCIRENLPLVLPFVWALVFVLGREYFPLGASVGYGCEYVLERWKERDDDGGLLFVVLFGAMPFWAREEGIRSANSDWNCCGRALALVLALLWRKGVEGVSLAAVV